MFTQLLPLLINNHLSLTISKGEEDLITVTVLPIPNETVDTKKSLPPISITGTAAELETNLPLLLENYTSKALGIISNIDEALEQLKETEKAIREEEKTKRKKLPKKTTESPQASNLENAVKGSEPLPEVKEGMGKTESTGA